jgi:hypothetical protein
VRLSQAVVHPAGWQQYAAPAAAPSPPILSLRARESPSRLRSMSRSARIGRLLKSPDSEGLGSDTPRPSCQDTLVNHSGTARAPERGSARRPKSSHDKGGKTVLYGFLQPSSSPAFTEAEPKSAMSTLSFDNQCKRVKQ